MRVFVYSVRRIADGAEYIGISQNPKHRWNCHVCDANAGSKTRFHNTLRKYGREAFTWTVIGDLPTADEAKIAERIAIAVRQPVLNLTRGGDGNFGLIVTESAKAKLRAHNLGKKASPETRAKLREARKRRVYSDETRAKMSASMRARYVSGEGKTQLDAARALRKFAPQPPKSAETRAKTSAGMKRVWAERKAGK